MSKFDLTEWAQRPYRVLELVLLGLGGIWLVFFGYFVAYLYDDAGTEWGYGTSDGDALRGLAWWVASLVAIVIAEVTLVALRRRKMAE